MAALVPEPSTNNGVVAGIWPELNVRNTCATYVKQTCFMRAHARVQQLRDLSNSKCTWWHGMRMCRMCSVVLALLQPCAGHIHWSPETKTTFVVIRQAPNSPEPLPTPSRRSNGRLHVCQLAVELPSEHLARVKLSMQIQTSKQSPQTIVRTKSVQKVPMCPYFSIQVETYRT